MAESFMNALTAAEEGRDPGPLAELFSADAELTNLVRDEPRRGRDGARRFWADYLHAFERIRSRFERVTEADGTAVLEWVSDGTMRDGRPVRYRGVSILQTDGRQVQRFRSYYDTAALHVSPGYAGQPDAGPIRELNERTQPRTPQGELIDPHQEPDPDTAG
jgi:ketosteroid isomerase-like protein